MAEIIVARSAGFCFGVERAVERVYEEAEKGGIIHTFGPIIHNEEVVRDLHERGVSVIEKEEDIPAVHEGTIIIRSHGVSRKIDEMIRATGAGCVDATCPFVKRIHRIVEENSARGCGIIIVGNPDHPEVQGIMGWSSTPVTVLRDKKEAASFAAFLTGGAGRAEGLQEGPEDGSAEGLTDVGKSGSTAGIADHSAGKAAAEEQPPLYDEYCVVSQTTFNANKFEEIVDILKKTGYNIACVNTICNATHERQAEAEAIARRADIMIVIGGRSSSNSAKLYEICRKECANTYFIQTWRDLNLSPTGYEQIIGITAGASTPKKIIEEVLNHVRADFRTNA